MAISDKKKEQIRKNSVIKYGHMYSYSDRINQAAEFFASAKEDFEACDYEFNDTFWNSIMKHHAEVNDELITVLGDALDNDTPTPLDYLGYLDASKDAEIAKSELKLNGLLSHVGGPYGTGKYSNSPFHELHRNPAAHFKAYCLSQGMSLEDFITLRKNPKTDEARQIKHRMDELTVPFLKGVMHPDEDMRIKFASDMYVGFIKKMDQEIPAITQKLAKGTNQELLDYVFVLKGISTSIGMQTLNLGKKSDQTPQQQKVMDNVTEQLKKDNVNVTLDHIHSFGAFGDLLTQYLYRDMSRSHIQSYDINSPNKETFTKLSDYMIGVKKYLSDQVKNNGGKGLSGDAFTKEIGQIFQDMNQGIQSSEALTDSIDTAQARIAQMFPYTADRINELQTRLSNLQTAMKNNVRKNIFGKPKKHSTEYQNILNKLGDIENSEAKDKSTLYKDLLTACNTYLSKRDPNSSVGQDRYGMVMQVENLARTMYQNAANYIPEDIKDVLTNAPIIKNSASKDQNSHSVNWNTFKERCINRTEKAIKQNDGSKLSRSATVTEGQTRKHKL